MKMRMRGLHGIRVVQHLTIVAYAGVSESKARLPAYAHRAHRGLFSEQSERQGWLLMS